MNFRKKLCFILFPVIAIAGHYFASGFFFYGISYLFVNIFHIPEEQLVNFSSLAEILVNTILILIFFTVYILVFRKDKNERKSTLNFKGQ